MTNPKVAIAILVAVHVITGLVLGGFAKDRPLSFLLAMSIGLVFCQTSLLGFWGGLGTNRWPIRLLGVAAGTAYLAPVFGLINGVWDNQLLLLVVLSTMAVAAVLLVIRRLFAQLRHTGEDGNLTGQEGLQFSIRQLMLLTFMVACTLGLGKWLHPYFPGNILATLATISLCYVSVGLASVWAMFGKSPSLIRSIVVLLTAVLSGGILAWLVMDGRQKRFWFSVTLAEAAFLLASLWIIRLCGYRLVRLSRSAGVNGVGQRQ